MATHELGGSRVFESLLASHLQLELGGVALFALESGVPEGDAQDEGASVEAPCRVRARMRPTDSATAALVV